MSTPPPMPAEALTAKKLREARRKTGVASSRQLARTLAEQKFWDRKKAALKRPARLSSGPV